MIYDVAIIGGGVVGGLIARELAKYRLNICILEKEDDIAMGATRANSAIVHGGFDPVPGTLKAKLNAEGEISECRIRITARSCSLSRRRKRLMYRSFTKEASQTE